MRKIDKRRNLCQICFKNIGRFILDCYCVICEKCYNQKATTGPFCGYCKKPTKGNKIDSTIEGSIGRISFLFENSELKLNKLAESIKFQNQATNRYIQFMEEQLQNYRQAVKELISLNPTLYNYFAQRIHGLDNKTQKNMRNYSIKQESTLKGQNFKESRSSDAFYSSRGQEKEDNIHFEKKNLKKRQHNKNNMSDNQKVRNKVSNMNYMTALKNSERMIDQSSSKIKINRQKEHEIKKKYARRQ